MSIAVSAAIIGNDDIHAIPTHIQGSGNGKLNLMLFTAETAKNNDGKAFDAGVDRLGNGYAPGSPPPTFMT